MPLSWLYGKALDLRNLLYDRGPLETYSLGARTISVGNITTGGTGKTPIVAHVAEILSSRNHNVCILTRGYGRRDPHTRVLVSDNERVLADPEEAGDEPVELARKLLGRAIVIADANRVAAGEWAKRRFGITAFILDDGFQHRRVQRDVDIICIDAMNPFGGGRTLPFGRLREPLENIRRADIVVITRAQFTPDLTELATRIGELTDALIFTSTNHITNIIKLEEFKAHPGPPAAAPWNELGDLAGTERTNLGAFCGLGNPENFFEQIRVEIAGTGQFALETTRSFPDHHIYTQSDITKLEQQAREAGVDAFLTTAKDAVKLEKLNFSIPCYVVVIGVRLDRPEEFAALL